MLVTEYVAVDLVTKLCWYFQEGRISVVSIEQSATVKLRQSTGDVHFLHSGMYKIGPTILLPRLRINLVLCFKFTPCWDFLGP